MTLFNEELTTGVLGLFIIALLLVIRAWMHRSVAAARPDAAVPAAKGELVFKLSSRGLALMLVDALVEHKILDPKQADEAVDVMTRKIDLRKALGDF